MYQTPHVCGVSPQFTVILTVIIVRLPKSLWRGAVAPGCPFEGGGAVLYFRPCSIYLVQAQGSCSWMSDSEPVSSLSLCTSVYHVCVCVCVCVCVSCLVTSGALQPHSHSPTRLLRPSGMFCFPGNCTFWSSVMSGRGRAAGSHAVLMEHSDTWVYFILTSDSRKGVQGTRWPHSNRSARSSCETPRSLLPPTNLGNASFGLIWSSSLNWPALKV